MAFKRFVKGTQVKTNRILGFNAAVPVGTEVTVQLGLGVMKRPGKPADYDYLVLDAGSGKRFFALHSELDPVGEAVYTDDKDDL